MLSTRSAWFISLREHRRGPAMHGHETRSPWPLMRLTTSDRRALTPMAAIPHTANTDIA